MPKLCRYNYFILKKVFTTVGTANSRRFKRENTIIIKQKIGHRVITKKVLKVGTFPEREKLCELLLYL